MKNKYLLPLMALMIAVKVTAAETDAQQVVAEIFKSHSEDQKRLQLLQACLANNFHTQDHNWFQRAANMTTEDEQKLIEEYNCHQKELEVRVRQLREAIKFLEDKLVFEYQQKVALERLTWEAGKEQRKKDDLIFTGGFLAVIGVMMAAASQMTF